MFKAFLVIFSYVTSYEFKNLVGWRQLNKLNKLLFINNKNIIKKLGIQTGIQIMCCWAVFLVMIDGLGMVILTTGGRV